MGQPVTGSLDQGVVEVPVPNTASQSQPSVDTGVRREVQADRVQETTGAPYTEQQDGQPIEVINTVTEPPEVLDYEDIDETEDYEEAGGTNEDQENDLRDKQAKIEELLKQQLKVEPSPKK